MAVHLSSRFLDLAPQVAAIANALGLEGLIQTYLVDLDDPDRGDVDSGISSSMWVILSKDRSLLEPLVDDDRWQDLQSVDTDDLWTDDHSNIFFAIKW